MKGAAAERWKREGKEFDAHVQITPSAVVYNTDYCIYNMVYNIFRFRFYASVMIPFVVQMPDWNV